MDPDAAYSIMTDPDVDPAERYDAAEGLTNWIHTGGYLPVAPWTTVPRELRRRIILAECASAMADADAATVTDCPDHFVGAETLRCESCDYDAATNEVRR